MHAIGGSVTTLVVVTMAPSLHENIKNLHVGTCW